MPTPQDITGYFIKLGSFEVTHPSIDEIIVFLLVLLIIVLLIYYKYIFPLILKRKNR